MRGASPGLPLPSCCWVCPRVLTSLLPCCGARLCPEDEEAQEEAEPRAHGAAGRWHRAGFNVCGRGAGVQGGCPGEEGGSQKPGALPAGTLISSCTTLWGRDDPRDRAGTGPGWLRSCGCCPTAQCPVLGSPAAPLAPHPLRVGAMGGPQGSAPAQPLRCRPAARLCLPARSCSGPGEPWGGVRVMGWAGTRGEQGLRGPGTWGLLPAPLHAGHFVCPACISKQAFTLRDVNEARCKESESTGFWHSCP